MTDVRRLARGTAVLGALIGLVVLAAAPAAAADPAPASRSIVGFVGAMTVGLVVAVIVLRRAARPDGGSSR